MAANLKEVRERIKSVLSTQQITKAMKMVSAAKLRRAQDAITNLRPYALKLNEMLSNIMANVDSDGSLAFNELRTTNSVLIVMVTSSRGLCGAFNTNIQKEATHLIETKYKEQFEKGQVRIVCIGKKGYDYARKRYPQLTIVTEHMDLFKDLTFDKISPVADLIMQRFLEKKYDAVEVVFGRFKNAAMQFAESEQYLPVISELGEEVDSNSHRADYIFDPNKEKLLQELVPSILQIQFQRYLLDTHASEHGARMTAMDKATENAEDRVRDLKIMYNKARQESITREISEIVGGAAALQG